MSTETILEIDEAVEQLLKETEVPTAESQQPNESEQPTAEQPEAQAEEESVILEKIIIGDAVLHLSNFTSREIEIRPISPEKVGKILKSGNVVGNYITNQNFDNVLRKINNNLPKMERKHWKGEDGDLLYIAVKSSYYVPENMEQLEFGLITEILQF